MGPELGDEIRGDVADDVHPAGLDLGHLGGGLGNGAEDQVLEGGLPAPVLVERLEADELVPLPLHELPGAGSHRGGRPERLVADRLDVLLVHDREEDQPLEQQRKRFVGDDVHGLRVHDLHFLDRADIAVLGRLLGLVDDPIERILHVRRGQDVAVVEANVLANLELPLGVRDRLPGRRQRRLELELGAAVQEGVEHVDVHEDPDPLEVHVGIEGRGVRHQGDGQRVLGLGQDGGGRGG